MTATHVPNRMNVQIAGGFREERRIHVDSLLLLGNCGSQISDNLENFLEKREGTFRWRRTNSGLPATLQRGPAILHRRRAAAVRRPVVRSSSAKEHLMIGSGVSLIYCLCLCPKTIVVPITPDFTAAM
jgi:hypothetical protein